MKRYRMGSEEILKAVNQFPFFIFFNPRESKSELNKKQRRVQPEAAQAQSGFRVADVVQRDFVEKFGLSRKFDALTCAICRDIKIHALFWKSVGKKSAFGVKTITWYILHIIVS